MRLKFEQVRVIDWSQAKVISTLDAKDAYGMMLRSSRWDSAHADAAVRTLCGHDCRRLEIARNTPVVFEQF